MKEIENIGQKIIIIKRFFHTQTNNVQWHFRARVPWVTHIKLSFAKRYPFTNQRAGESD